MDEESLRETVKALVKTKQYEKALVEQGYIYYKMKRFRNSLAAFDRAIELDDQSGAAWVGRALALHGLARDQSRSPPTAERETWLRKMRAHPTASGFCS